MVVNHFLRIHEGFFQKFGEGLPQVTSAVKDRALVTPCRGHHLNVTFPISVNHNEFENKFPIALPTESYP